MASGPSLKSARVLFFAALVGTLCFLPVWALPIAATTPPAVTPADEVGTIPWEWVGLGVGLPLLLFGLWLLVGPGRDCERLRREWEALQRQYEEIREAHNKAAAYLEERRVARAEILETDREGLDVARDAERMAEESVESWRGQLEQAAAKADAARRVYEECIGKAGLTTPSEGSTTAGGGPVAATAPPDLEQGNPPEPSL